MALEALVAGAEPPFLPPDGPDEGVTPSLGGRVDGALPEATPGAWDAPADSYKPPLGDRVDAALDALTTWEDSSPSEASWDTEWAEPEAPSRALDLFASALTDEQLADAGLDESRVIGLDGRPIDDTVEDFLDFIEEQEEEEIEFYDERLGVVPSHELIEVDEDGDPITETARMTYVDEAAELRRVRLRVRRERVQGRVDPIAERWRVGV